RLRQIGIFEPSIVYLEGNVECRHWIFTVGSFHHSVKGNIAIGLDAFKAAGIHSGNKRQQTLEGILRSLEGNIHFVVVFIHPEPAIEGGEEVVYLDNILPE